MNSLGEAKRTDLAQPGENQTALTAISNYLLGGHKDTPTVTTERSWDRRQQTQIQTLEV